MWCDFLSERSEVRPTPRPSQVSPRAINGRRWDGSNLIVTRVPSPAWGSPRSLVVNSSALGFLVWWAGSGSRLAAGVRNRLPCHYASLHAGSDHTKKPRAQPPLATPAGRTDVVPAWNSNGMVDCDRHSGLRPEQAVPPVIALIGNKPPVQFDRNPVSYTHLTLPTICSV